MSCGKRISMLRREVIPLLLQPVVHPTRIPEHPRLLLLKGQEQSIKKIIGQEGPGKWPMM